jgi:hypothetical protein
MARVEFIQHKEKKILVVDLSDNKDIKAGIELLNMARAIIDAQPPSRC